MKRSGVWGEAIVQSTRDLTPTIREFVIAPTSPRQVTWECGAHLQVKIPVNNQLQMRRYSLVGLPDGGTWKIAVKRMDDGRGGSKAMWNLRKGDSLQVSAPHSFFALDHYAKSYLLIAAGVGITPLLAMAQTLALKSGETSVRMLYAARSREELAYVNVLRDALGARLEVFIDDEGPRIDFAAEIAKLPEAAQLYTCGPVLMLEAIRNAWLQAGRKPALLRFETFGSSGSMPTQTFRLLVPRHQVDVMVPIESTLLDALEAAGVPTLFNCQRGECGLCTMDVLAVDGEIDHRDVFLSAHQKSQGEKICVCVSRVAGSITLDSAYRAS